MPGAATDGDSQPDRDLSQIQQANLLHADKVRPAYQQPVLSLQVAIWLGFGSRIRLS